MKQMLCFTIFFLATEMISEAPARLFVVWDVGQGAWSTLVESHTCYHLDMGGEKFTFAESLRNLCGNKRNVLFITHFDSDHINLVGKARFALPQFCRATPIAASANERKRRRLAAVADCPPADATAVRQIFSADFEKRNDCNMYIAAGQVLVTGDAPASLERRILSDKGLVSIRYFLLGHHGSRTSSSPALLQKLPHLLAGIASARMKKYGHPHRETVERLRSLAIPLLTTEERGSIFIHLDERPVLGTPRSSAPQNVLPFTHVLRTRRPLDVSKAVRFGHGAATVHPRPAL